MATEEELERSAGAPDENFPAQRAAMRVKWDEKDISAHDAERGIAFGTMKIDQTDTPYLCACAYPQPWWVAA